MTTPEYDRQRRMKLRRYQEEVDGLVKQVDALVKKLHYSQELNERVATVLEQLVEEMKASRRITNKVLRAATNGGAPLPPEIHEPS